MTRRHIALAIAVAVVWGLNFVVIDEGLKVFPPLLFVALRFTIVVFPAIFLVGRPRVPARYVIGVGAFSGAMQFGLLFISLSVGMPPGLASLVVQLQVVFTIAIAAVVLGERPHRRQLAGALVALGGVGVIAATRTGVVVPLGALALCIAGSASWGIGNVITRIARPSRAAAFLVWTSLVPPIPLFALSLLTEGPARIGTAFRSLTVTAVLALPLRCGAVDSVRVRLLGVPAAPLHRVIGVALRAHRPSGGPERRSDLRPRVADSRRGGRRRDRDPRPRPGHPQRANRECGRCTHRRRPRCRHHIPRPKPVAAPASRSSKLKSRTSGS